MRAIGIGQCSWDRLALVEGYPEPDTKAEALEWAEHGGGPAATACAALSRLAVSTAFFGVVGDDADGQRIVTSLKSVGVDTSGIAVRENSRSQSAFIAVERASARRTIFWQRPTGAPLVPDELPPVFLDGADLVIVDGLMGDVSLFAVRRAEASGVPVVVDAGRMRQGMMELCKLSGHVVGAEQFALDLGLKDISDDGFFLEAASMFPGALTITLGPSGSVTVSDGELLRTPAYKVDAVDTTGAGDAFHAGYAFGVMSGWDIMKTLRFASVVAGLSCRALGGRAALPTLVEALAHLNAELPSPSAGGL
ncbi:MAG: hypothetical protein KAR83_10320 [Thermodesulfovibrionales bacterium]|nr:hypothetical protein [Thermodesulfovibrionales bacterium]